MHELLQLESQMQASDWNQSLKNLSSSLHPLVEDSILISDAIPIADQIIH